MSLSTKPSQIPFKSNSLAVEWKLTFSFRTQSHCSDANLNCSFLSQRTSALLDLLKSWHNLGNENIIGNNFVIGQKSTWFDLWRSPLMQSEWEWEGERETLRNSQKALETISCYQRLVWQYRESQSIQRPQVFVHVRIFFWQSDLQWSKSGSRCPASDLKII